MKERENERCANCCTQLIEQRSDAKFCQDKCRYQFHYKHRTKSDTPTKKVKENLNSIKSSITSKIEYARLTFILSVIGFIGSIGFYIGVLKEVYSPEKDKYQIEVLKEENRVLIETLDTLNSDSK